MLVIGGRGDEVGVVLHRLETQEGAGGRRRTRLATRRDVLSYTNRYARPRRMEIGEFTSWNAHMPDRRQDGLSLVGQAWGMRKIVSVAVQ